MDELHAPSERDMGSAPGRGTKIPHTASTENRTAARETHLSERARTAKINAY